MSKVTVTFIPQKWGGRRGNDLLDAEFDGERDTKFVVDSCDLDGLKPRSQGADSLKDHPEAPAWINEWDGPYEFDWDVSFPATDMRVWWIPQIPGHPFHVKVKNEDEAILILNTLANYDLFQFKNKIKGDYCNVGGLEVNLDDGWNEWTDNDGDDINDVMKSKKAPWVKPT